MKIKHKFIVNTQEVGVFTGRFGSDSYKIVNREHGAGTSHALTETEPNCLKTRTKPNRINTGNHGSVHG